MDPRKRPRDNRPLSQFLFRQKEVRNVLASWLIGSIRSASLWKLNFELRQLGAALWVTLDKDVMIERLRNLERDTRRPIYELACFRREQPPAKSGDVRSSSASERLPCASKRIDVVERKWLVLERVSVSDQVVANARELLVSPIAAKLLKGFAQCRAV